MHSGMGLKWGKEEKINKNNFILPPTSEHSEEVLVNSWKNFSMNLHNIPSHFVARKMIDGVRISQMSARYRTGNARCASKLISYSWFFTFTWFCVNGTRNEISHQIIAIAREKSNSLRVSPIIQSFRNLGYKQQHNQKDSLAIAKGKMCHLRRYKIVNMSNIWFLFHTSNSSFDEINENIFAQKNFNGKKQTRLFFSCKIRKIHVIKF